MPQIDDPRQLFAFKLSKVHSSEREILQLLKTVQKEANDQELASGFEQHARETEQQIQNLEQALQVLGEQPQEPKARVIEALRNEHEDFKKQGAPPELQDAFIAGAAEHVEHHEISAYEGLITMAQAMGQQQIVDLLQQNLQQEQNTLQKVQSASQRLAQQLSQQVPV